MGLAAEAFSEFELMPCDSQRPTKRSEGLGEALSLAFIVTAANIRFDASDLSRIPDRVGSTWCTVSPTTVVLHLGIVDDCLIGEWMSFA